MPQRPPSDDPLPDDESSSLYQASNAVGTPPGKGKAGAPVPAAAEGGTESGNQNFSFALPIVGLPGRGIDVSLSLVYNSQLWNKSTDPSDSSTWMSYDVDSGWPSPGFRICFAQVEDQGSYGFTLTDANGTRHPLAQTGTYDYDTTDGTYIHYYHGGSWGTLVYADGTYMYLSATGGGYRRYPTFIEDRNGNYLNISYVSNVGPKIDSIEDTLGRYVQFHYTSGGDLITITAPGFNGGSDLQMMRFYYTDVTIPSSGLFGSGVNVSTDTPSSIHTLQYVYLPTSSDGSYAHIGYKFDYSPYGMMYQTTQFRGMTVSTTSTSSAGSVTSDGTQAAITSYNYPTSGGSLTDVPTYSTRSDDWAGRTTSMSGGAPYYTFTNNSATGVSTVTAPDGSITETDAIVDAGVWDDGLISDTYVKNSSSTTMTHTKLDWQLDSGSSNPRVYQIRETNGPAGLTKATVLSYTSYNNVSTVSEKAFTTDGSVSSTELRRTETTYVTSSSYITRRHLHLPSVVKVFPGGSSTPISRVDYAYDGSSLTERSDIIMHDDYYNPYSFTEGLCDQECMMYDGNGNCTDWEWVCPYDSSSDYRGNVTSVTTYPDATTTSGAITHSSTYDIAGNVVTTQVDCCQLKSIAYSNSYYYAYPTSVTSGASGGPNVTIGATYDFDTGLVATTIDENSQTTTNYYNSDSLRPNHVSNPDGGATYFYYGDSLSADAASHYHYYTMASTKFGSGSSDWSDVYTYRDGRGAPAQALYNGTGSGPWTTYLTEYDTMGRAYRVSNPYSDSTGYGGSLNPSGLWTTQSFDSLGRVTSVTMPSGDDSSATTAEIDTTYDGYDSGSNDGIFTTVTDQAGMVRRQKVDALGRMIRLDEPTSSGLGTTGSPNQPTTYTYSALDDLVHISQGSQDRYFMYDSLSRLIRERQVEQTTNSSYDLSDPITSNSSWTRKLVYNSSGLVTDAYDARGVHSTLSYDGLNRVTQITYSDSTPTAHYYYDSTSSLPSGHPSYTLTNGTGRLVAMTYGSTATGDYFNYDSMGRVTSQWQVTGSSPTTYSLSYSYNYAGELGSETYPSGRSLTYSYGAGARLSSITDGTTTFTSSLSYDPSGGLSSETWGNTAVHTMTYNHALQVAQAKLTLSGTVLQQYDYNYGAFNTSSGAVDTTKNNGQLGKVLGTIGSTAQWNQGFSYDEVGRISNVTEHQGSTMTTQTYSQSYGYDRYGNRNQSANSTLGLPAVASTDYSTTTNRFGSSLATYDNSGNITTDSKFRSLNYSYDANSCMTYASDGTNSLTSTYDCAGNRVQNVFSVGATLTDTLVYDVFGQLIADYTGSTGGTLAEENVYRGGQLLARRDGGSGNWTYALTDLQGSTRAVMNNNGSSSTVISRHDFLPFGEEIASGIGLRSSGQGYGAGDNIRQKYALTERDSFTGLDHADWRKYESFSGRWTSPDPYTGSMTTADPQSFNRYAYTQNDPVNFVDPSGLDISFTPRPPSHPHYPDPLFDDYMINAWEQGWSQMYGLNPLSFTFLTGFGSVGEWNWSEYTKISLGWPQQTLQDVIRENAQTAASQKLIDSEKCRTFMSRLINGTLMTTGPSIKGVEVSAWYGLNAYSEAAIAGRITASGSSGLEKDGSTTYGKTSPATGTIRWNQAFYDLDKAGAALQILHESLHLIPGFTDQALAQQASIIADPKHAKTFGSDDKGQIDASRYLNEQIKNHCQ